MNVLSHLDSEVSRRLEASNFRVVITGASGWIGMATLEMLFHAFGPAFAARVKCFGSARRSLQLRNGQTIQQLGLEKLSDLPSHPTILLHLAFLTKDKVNGMSEAEYIDANNGIAGLVEQSLSPIDVRAIWIASSGAAYRADDEAASPAMRLYGRLKLADERRFAEWAENTGRRAVITRVFNVSGPYINKPEHYALGSFIVDALAGKPVEVRAPFRVIRGMVAIRELMSVVFAELLAAPSGVEQFDSGGTPLELGELAAHVAAVLGSHGYIRAPITEDRVDSYLGNELSWTGLCEKHGISRADVRTQIRETADLPCGFNDPPVDDC